MVCVPRSHLILKRGGGVGIRSLHKFGHSNQQFLEEFLLAKLGASASGTKAGLAEEPGGKATAGAGARAWSEGKEPAHIYCSSNSSLNTSSTGC
jgi:hypothetical protein